MYFVLHFCIFLHHNNKQIEIMKHFETRKEAVKFAEETNRFHKSVSVFKKIKGHKNRIKKPFVVGSQMEFLNLN
jgi:hypothetical protein